MAKLKQKQNTINQDTRLFTSRALKLEQDKERFLYDHGWRSTSNFPDFAWRWFKEIDGQRITVPHQNLDEAIGLELAIYLRDQRDNKPILSEVTISGEM